MTAAVWIAAVWVAAVVLLIVTLAACAVVLIRRGVRLLAALADLFAAPAILDGVYRAEPEARETPAVLLPVAVVRASADESRRARIARTQARHRARLERARAITRAITRG